MTFSKYKYIVTVEGLQKPMVFYNKHDALYNIALMMPCTATIEAKED